MNDKIPIRYEPGDEFMMDLFTILAYKNPGALSVQFANAIEYANRAINRPEK